jgi:hypothetical protein
MNAPSDDLDLFFGLVANLNLRWRLFEEVFLSEEGVGVFNEAGIGVWEVMRECTLDALLMDIARLMDPKTMRGRTNLTFELVIQQIPRTAFTKDLDIQMKEAEEIFTMCLKPWRNRRLGHNDRESLTNREPLPDIPYEQIGLVVKLISKIAKSIAATARDRDQSFVPYILGSDWAARLFLILRAGLEVVKERGVAAVSRKQMVGPEK